MPAVVKRIERKPTWFSDNGDLEKQYITLICGNNEIDVNITISHCAKFFGTENIERYHPIEIRLNEYPFYGTVIKIGEYQSNVREEHLKNNYDIWDCCMRSLQWDMAAAMHEALYHKNGSAWQIIRDVYPYEWKCREYPRKE